ncbi:MAG: hypothetical protein NW216_07855 [Hyphomicrobium sp.]|nr:hypothetical protein [Hyphomicrobium sp.]
MRSRSLFVCLAIIVAAMTVATSADARCTINSAGLSVSPLSANTGTYTPPTAPVAQSVTFTISGTYDTNATAGTCRVGIAFHRTSLPATMARSGGGATLPYTITTASGGGTSLLYTGGGVPAAASILISAFTSAGANLNNRAFSTTVTAYFRQVPGSPQRAGSYSDAPSLRTFNIRQNGNVTQLTSQAFSVTGTVALSCTIGGVTSPTADSATIPVASGGVVATTPITRSYANVVCNSLTAVQARSLSGAVKNAGSAPSGFSNMINYTAAATFSGATSNLNTATIPTASGVETGTSATTASATPTGSLSVTITPQTPSQRLISGGYSDTLRITVTAQ